MRSNWHPADSNTGTDRPRISSGHRRFAKQWLVGISMGIGAIASLLLTGTTAVEAQSSFPSGFVTQAQPPRTPTSTQIVYVDATRGSDSQGTGAQNAPLRSITAVLRFARAGTTIQLAPGTYSAETGEVFPLELPSQVVLKGNESSYGDGYIIDGGGPFISMAMARQSVTILPEDGAEIRGVTVRNQGRRGYAIWLESTSPTIYRNTFSGNVHDGVFIVGSSNASIDSNRFYRNGANGITVLGTATPVISNNLIQETGYGITTGDRSSPLISNNRISRNRSGLVATGNATPKLRQNAITENLEAGVVAIGNSLPDLGSPVEPGQNLFEGNGEFAIHNATRTQILQAHGNQISDGNTLRGEIAMNNPDATAEGTRNTVPQLVEEEPLTTPDTVASAETTSGSEAIADTTANTEAPIIAAAPAPTNNSAPTNPDEFRSVPFSPTNPTPITTASNSNTSNDPNIPAPIPLTDDVVSVATQVGAQYRVIITPRADDTLDRLRQVAPNATATELAGRSVFVVGQYSSRTETQQVLDNLTSAGYFAVAETVR